MLAGERAPLDPAAVRDTLDAVARSAAFTRPWRERFLVWLFDVGRQIARLIRGSGVTSPVVFWTVAVLAAGLLTWAVVRALDRREGGGRTGRGGRPALAGDSLQAAELAAAAGRYAEGAHHLYAAVVEALAARALVRPHPAKTAGDYGRELRRRTASTSGPAGASTAGGATTREAARAYAIFARGYEAVVYGPRAPDRAAYEALRRAADALVAPVGTTAGTTAGTRGQARAAA